LNASPIRSISGELKIGNTTVAKRDFSIRNLIDSIRVAVKAVDARRIVIDSIAFLAFQCPDAAQRRNATLDLIVNATDKNAAKKKISEFNARSTRRVAPIVVDANELVELKKEDRPLYDRIGKGVTLWESEYARNSDDCLILAR